MTTLRHEATGTQPSVWQQHSSDLVTGERILLVRCLWFVLLICGLSLFYGVNMMCMFARNFEVWCGSAISRAVWMTHELLSRTTPSWFLASWWTVQTIQGLSHVHTIPLWYRTFWIGSTRDGQSWLAFLMQVSIRKVRNTMHSGVGI